jgi:hypothetical protein
LRNKSAFFSRGTSGQWRDLLDDADLARYAARVRALASGNLVPAYLPRLSAVLMR